MNMDLSMFDTRPLDFTNLVDTLTSISRDAGQRRDEIEQLRSIPEDLLDRIRESGVLKSGLPKELGGMDLTSSEITQLIEILSYGDASLGWTMMVGIDGAMYPLDDSVSKTYFGDRGYFVAGMLVPCGVATAEEGGYTLNGSWTMASGFDKADLIASGAYVINSDGSKRITPSGHQEWRVFLLPKTQAKRSGDWSATGLSGTGSVDYRISDQFVLESHTFQLGLSDREPGRREFDVLMRKMPGVAIGMTRAALDYARSVANEKESTKNGPWRDSYRVQYTIGECEMLYIAMRESVYGTLDKRWSLLSRGKPYSDFSPDEKIDTVAARVFAIRQAREIVRKLYDLFGASSVYRDNPLDRWLRDIETMNQHLMAQDKILQSCGATLLASPPQAPIAVGAAPAILH